MRRVTAITWSLLAACGRIGFAPCLGCTSSDAPGPIAIVQTGATLSGPPITLAPTRDGSMIVVGAVIDGTVIASITDDAGNAYRSANVTSEPGAGCTRTLELWYTANARPATTITVAEVGTGPIPGAWAVEVAGASATPVAGMQTSAQVTTNVIAVPAITAPAGTVVFSTVIVCNNELVGVHFGTTFMGLPVAAGAGDIAYAIANADAMYGASWDLLGTGNTGWGGATVAFQ